MTGNQETGNQETGSGRVAMLRGAGVAEVDGRRLVRAGAGVCLVALAVLAIVLFVAGARKNAEITDLRSHGVPVEVTVSRCLGLLGGSGSNEAGYACRGTYTFGGHRYDEAIPGDIEYPPGARIRGVTVPGDPGLFSTARIVSTERASGSVFVVPAVLLAVLAVLAGGLVFLRRRTAAGGAGQPALCSSPEVGSVGRLGRGGV